MSSTKKTILGATIAVALVAALTIGVFAVAMGRDYSVLLQDRDVMEIAVMSAVLADQGVRHRVLHGGTALEVAFDQVDDARALIAQYIDPDDAAFTWSDAHEVHERILRSILAQEADIALQLENIDGVESAAVLLRIPVVRDFDQDLQHPAASVALTVSREFSSDEAHAMAMVVVRSVVDLALADVMIVDQHAQMIFPADDGLVRTEHGDDWSSVYFTPEGYAEMDRRSDALIAEFFAADPPHTLDPDPDAEYIPWTARMIMHVPPTLTRPNAEFFAEVPVGDVYFAGYLPLESAEVLYEESTMRTWLVVYSGYLVRGGR